MSRSWATVGRPSVNRGFSGRLTLDEIEMTETIAPDSPTSKTKHEGIETTVVTPTSLTTRMGESEVDLGAHSPNGSTVELNPRDELGDSSRGRAF